MCTSAIDGGDRMPAGRSQPASVRGTVSVRSTASITGAGGRVSFTPRRGRVVVAGLELLAQAGKHARVAQQQVEGKARPVAVVSCPATSIVNSSSRSSASVIARAVLVAGAQQQRQHVGALARGRARDDAARSPRTARVGGAQTPANRPPGLSGPRSIASAGEIMKIGLLSITATSARAGARPARLGHAEDGAADHLERERAHTLAQHQPRAHPPRPSSRSATSRMTSRKAATREPWNGGSNSFRWRRCSGPSRTRTECGSQHRFHERVRLAGAKVRLIAGEQLADRVRDRRRRRRCRIPGSSG